MRNLGKIKEIFIYPIKSLPGIKLDKCLVTTHGIVHPDHPAVIDRFGFQDLVDHLERIENFVYK